MGAYLRKPVTTKLSEDGYMSVSGEECQYTVTTMRGWRITMEDAYSVIPDFSNDSVLLGVYDGHGGKEVAVYCTQHMCKFLKESKAYNNNNIIEAMKEAFMSCDRSLLTEEAIKEMRLILEEEEGEGEGEQLEDEDIESDNEIDKLVQEASMPLEDVLMARIDSTKIVKSLVDLANKGLKSKLHSELATSETALENSNEDEENENESNSSRVRKFRHYEQFFQELVTKEGALSKELTAILDEEYSFSDDEDEEEDKEQEEEEENEEEEDSGEESGEKEEEEEKNNHSNLDRSENVVLERSTEQSGARRKRKRDVNETELEEKQRSAKRQNVEIPENSEGYESGTTAIVCLIRDKDLVVANTGDSRCVLSCKGQYVNLSEDHKPTDPKEQARIENAGGVIDEDLRVNGGLNMSRAIGDHMYKENNELPLEEQMITALPDVLCRNILSDDEFIVIASDGIWNCMGSQDVVNFIRERLITMKKQADNDLIAMKGEEQLKLSVICEELCDSCLAPNTDNDGSGCDNMTVILALLKPLKSLFL